MLNMKHAPLKVLSGSICIECGRKGRRIETSASLKCIISARDRSHLSSARDVHSIIAGMHYRSLMPTFSQIVVTFRHYGPEICLGRVWECADAAAG